MFNRGQIFSIDLILAVILIILFIGVTINIAEHKTYNEKEVLEKRELNNTAEAAAIALLNGKYSCTSGGLALSNTINTTKIMGASNLDINNYLGLNDFNSQISLGGIPTAMNDLLTGANTVVYNFDVLTCSGNTDIDLKELNKCIQGKPCTYAKKTLILKVNR